MKLLFSACLYATTIFASFAKHSVVGVCPTDPDGVYRLATITSPAYCDTQNLVLCCYIPPGSNFDGQVVQNAIIITGIRDLS